MASLDKTALARTRREILGKSDRIAPLPDVVVRVISMLNDPQVEPEDLAAHLRNDHVLVAKMLAMVNSPYYGLNREIVTIKEAVMVLGFRGLRSLTIAAATAQYLERDYGCYGHTDKGLWMHSLAVAAAASDLARSAGGPVSMREEMFVAGLLHDIGKMLLSTYLQDGSVIPSRGQLADLESERLGMDHGEAGALVCAKWNLSVLVQETLTHHHGHSGPDELELPCAIVRLADALAHDRGSGFRPGQAPAPDYRSRDLQLLGLEEDQWERARCSATDAMDRALASFNSLLLRGNR